MHVMLLKTIYWMSSHQNLNIRLISIIVFLVTVVYVSSLPVSAEGNENSFHRFCKVYKHGSFP